MVWETSTMTKVKIQVFVDRVVLRPKAEME
jgi:hypothetical protein